MIGIGKKIKNQNGTTLFELIVAMAIFVVLLLAVTAIYQLVYQAERNAVDARNTQESMRYVMEVFSKELRSAKRGDDGTCGASLVNKIYYTTGTELDFRNYKDQCVRYYLSGNSLVVERKDGATDIIATATPNEIGVSNLRFEVQEVVLKQSRVTFKADVEALNRTSNRQQLKIQTTISSRFYD
jgi:prepilin-type N-terminal cleavage/methylation domain-containing protein